MSLTLPTTQERRRWVVARFGAYMHYAVPRMLHNAGLLSRLYTDFYAGPIVGGLLSLGQWRNSTVNRALGRYSSELPNELVHSYPMLGFEYAIAQRLLRDPEALDELYLRMGTKFGKAVARDGFAGAQGLYCFNTAALDVLRAAKERGLVTVLDQTIAPRAVEETLLAEEHRRFPGWEMPRRRGPAVEATIQREKDEWDLADLIFCPSEFVRQGVIQSGGAAHKCGVIPYGVDSRFAVSTRSRRAGRLRVLSVGQVGLRKGIGYAREVARTLGDRAEFRWVGHVVLSEHGRNQVRPHITLTGAIPRNQIFTHFEWADVFFLPSVCEGSATVVYEALISGLPVLATPNTGSIVVDGLNGFIVPMGETLRMVQKLRRLHEDRELLHKMQLQAAQASNWASLEAYQERLLHALTDSSAALN